VLYAIGAEEQAAHFVEAQGLERLSMETAPRKDIQQEMGLAEVMIAPDSALIDQTLYDAAFRSRRHVSVLAIRRGGEPIEASLADQDLKFGDTLLVSGSWKDIGLLQAEKQDLIVLNLPVELEDFAPARRQAPWALAILIAMILAMTFGLVANAIAVLIAALAMVAARCLTMETAYKVINWPSLVLVAGMLPLATALQNTGATDLIVDGLVDGFGDLGPTAMMTGLFVLTAVLGLFISNTATAVLLAPIAIGIAGDMGVSPYPFAMTVAVAASAAFMTPVSTPVNTLVVAPGGYTFGDFAKVGVPMTILVMIVADLLIPLLFPFERTPQPRENR
jgi:di/tricarboxylate transporter